jgi:hypothetical protein
MILKTRRILVQSGFGPAPAGQVCLTVNTTKAYLAGLGTTGILIGSAVLTLMLGTGFVAFESTPELDRPPYPLERVVVREAAPRPHPAERRVRR